MKCKNKENKTPNFQRSFFSLDFPKIVQILHKITKDNLRFPNIAEESTNMLHDDFRTEQNSFVFRKLHLQIFPTLTPGLPEDSRVRTIILKLNYYCGFPFNFSYVPCRQAIMIFIVQFWQEHILAHCSKLHSKSCEHDPKRTHYLHFERSVRAIHINKTAQYGFNNDWCKLQLFEWLRV